MWLTYLKPVVKQFEGLSLIPYKCPAGYWTIGWGHLLSRDKNLPRETWPDINLAQAEELLEKDCRNAKRAVNRLCPGVTRDQQIAALSDFVFNLGAGYLEVSTLRKRINRGEQPRDPDEFMKWVYGGGKILNGLVKRRKVDSLLYFS